MNFQITFNGISILGNFNITQFCYQKFESFISTNVVMIAVQHMCELKNPFYQLWSLEFTHSSGIALIRDGLLYSSDIFQSWFWIDLPKAAFLKREEINR